MNAKDYLIMTWIHDRTIKVVAENTKYSLSKLMEDYASNKISID